MADLLRPTKEGSVRTYQEKVGLGFVDILASEMDADLDTIYTAWNGGVDTTRIGNGSVTYAKLAPDAQLWTDTGTALTPGASFTGRPIVAAPIADAFVCGTSTVKTRLAAASATSAHWRINAAASLAIDDPSKPAWALSMDCAADVFGVFRAPAASTAAYTQLLSVSSTGNQTIPGSLTVNTPNAANGGQAVLISHSTTGIRLAVNDRWAPPTASKPSWNFEMDGAVDVQLLHRAASAATGSADHSFLFSRGGDFQISGSNAYKATGTTWANPSDRRIKSDIEDYPTGLAAVVGLQPRTFVYNGKGGSAAGVRGYGFIADEVAPVMPEMVGTMMAKLNADDEAATEIHTVDESNLILALVNAVRELAARVDALEAPA